MSFGHHAGSVPPARRTFHSWLQAAVAPPEIGAISISGPVQDSTVQGLPTASGVGLTVARGHPRRPGRGPVAGDRQRPFPLTSCTLTSYLVSRSWVFSSPRESCFVSDPGLVVTRPLARGLLVAWVIRGWSRWCCLMPSGGRWRTGRS